MPYVAPEVVQRVKQIDLLTYLKNYEPYELVHFSGNTYTTRTHDSLKISNGKWMCVFCQVLFLKKSVGIPFFQQGIFPAFSGHYASLRMRACSIR